MDRTKQDKQLSELVTVPMAGKILENYDHIILTDEESSEALRQARKRKHLAIEEKAYWDKIRQPVSYPIFNSDSLASFILTNNPEFKIDEHNERIFDCLCLYFTGDSRFETDLDMSLKKGIILYGPVGCGKTYLMRLFQKNSFRPFVINPVRKIADEYSEKDGGVDALIKFSTLLDVHANQNFGLSHAGRCFDDIGTEEEKKNFGNGLNVIQDVLYKVYDNRLIGNFHGTTNLNGDEIEAAYGQRIRSRMREMFNVIDFPSDAPDRRL